MRFGSPLDLLWLAPILGGILLLYLLKKRRKDVVVPSLMLWEKILQSAQADTPWQRLRPTFLLFLQLLTAFLLVAALAGPYVLGSGLAGRLHILVIDNGGRMNATDVLPSRLAAAKADLQRALASEMGPRDRAMVIADGGHARVIAAPTADRRRLGAAIQSVPATDASADLAGAMVLARAAAGRQTGDADVHLFGDGAMSATEAQQAIQAADGIPASLSPIGEGDAQNTGILAMDARRDPDDPAKGYQVFVGVRDFGPKSLHGAQLTLDYGGRRIAARPLPLRAGESQTMVFESPAFAAGGVVTASLTGLAGDDLAADNTASVVLPQMRARRVLLVTAGDVYLEKGLGLDPSVRLFEIAPKDFQPADSGGYDVVVFDDFLPASLPPGRYLVFHAENPQMPVVSAGSDEPSPQVLDWSSIDSVMRFVDLSSLAVKSAARVSAAPWGNTLAEADSGPLIVSGDKSGRRIVWVAFSPVDSNFGLRISFPIFLTNAMDWLSGNGGAPLGSLSPAEPIALPSDGDWTIIRPDGGREDVDCAAGAPCVYAGDDRAGVYTAVSGAQTDRYAVDIDDPTISDLPEQSIWPAAGSAAAGAAHTEPARVDVWLWLAAAALALLALEWVAYHRRI